ncbi:HDOD domain-containing protein [Candidatus Latescibacterota bacterium]
MGKTVEFIKRNIVSMELKINKNKELQMLIQAVNESDISSFRKVLMLLLSVINNPRSNVKDIKVIIEKDPSLSARLLRLVNSTYYSSGKAIGNIQDAIVRIGLNTVKELALSQKVGELFNKSDLLHGYSRSALWEHSNAVALCCKLIYLKDLGKAEEDIYLVGLLHDIGIIIEDQFLPDKFKDALVQSQNEKCNLTEAENSIIGFDHTKIGGALTSGWNFPQNSSAAIAYHHEPDKVDDKLKEIVSVLYISDYICQRNEIGYCDALYEKHIYYADCLKFLGITEDSMNNTIEQIKEIIQKMKAGGWFS